MNTRNNKKEYILYLCMEASVRMYIVHVCGNEMFTSDVFMYSSIFVE